MASNRTFVIKHATHLRNMTGSLCVAENLNFLVYMHRLECVSAACLLFFCLSLFSKLLESYTCSNIRKIRMDFFLFILPLLSLSKDAAETCCYFFFFFCYSLQCYQRFPEWKEPPEVPMSVYPPQSSLAYIVCRLSMWRYATNRIGTYLCVGIQYICIQCGPLLKGTLECTPSIFLAF